MQTQLEKYPKWIIHSDGRLESKRYKGRILSPKVKENGYLEVDGNKYVHRVIAEAFVDGYFEGATVNHIDGDKSNNHYTNLEWVTRGDNVRKHYEGKRELPIGIYKVKNRYKVSKWHNDKNVHIGSFKTVEEAVEFRNNHRF